MSLPYASPIILVLVKIGKKGWEKEIKGTNVILSKELMAFDTNLLKGECKR